MTSHVETAPDSTTSGPALAEISGLVCGPRADHMLRRAAAQAPERTALRWRDGAMTYAEFDDAVSSCAAALRAELGDEPAVVALALVMDPTFPVAFFALTRAGHVPALVNPLLREDRLVHLIGVCGARAAIVSPEIHRRLRPALDRLPDLGRIILTHRDAGPDDGDDALPAIADLVAAGRPAPPEPDADLDGLCCLQFTSGTTGAPKAVRLSHGGLAVNAAQTAYAQGLDGMSVLFNYLPSFHVMHLTIAVTVAATLVLWTGPDAAESVEAADRYRATHYYTLPVRLNGLAVDRRLNELEAPSLRAILSGGSALPSKTATVLGQHFGVPVVQGFGIQEMSPLITFDDIARAKAGSVGRPIAGTTCRIADPGTGATLPVGERGELQAKGPQLMLGYLGRDLSLDTGPDGWLATGDIGYIDSDGYLFVCDRLKDVFKCDNYLVSPTEIERVLLRHPDVADCVVFDVPHEFSGAVAYGMVVPARPAAPDEIAAYVAARLPYYEHLSHVELVTEIPRSPQGKVQRRDLRAEVLARTRP